MSLEKLKDTARKFEQKEDWRKAIEAYLKAIQQIESGKDATPDLSLYNRVGDLYLKVGDTASAVRHYERAVELYGDQGFFNNAIALCGKILRVNPGRTATYLHLARLHARKNVVIEAKRNLLEYLERMNAQGQLDEAFGAVKAFADQFSGSQDIRVMLVELLRAASRGEEAEAELDKLCTDLEARGDAPAARVMRERLEPVEHEEQSPPARQRAGDLVFIDTGFGVPAGHQAAPDQPVAAAPVEPLAPLVEEPATPANAGTEAPPEPVGGFETTILHGAEDISAGVSEPMAGMDGLMLEGVQTVADEGPPADAQGLGLEGVRTVEFEEVQTVDFEGVQLSGFDDGLGLEPAAEVSLGPVGFDDEPAPDLSDVLAESLADAASVDADAPADAEPVALDFVEPAPEAGVAETAEFSAPVAEPELAPVAVPGGAASDTTASPGGVVALEQAVADRPDDPAAHRALGEALHARGDRRRAADEFLFAAEAYEAREAWQEAADLIARVVELEADDIRHYQKAVELAYRTGSRSRMLDAYLALAHALRRMGEVEKAIAVYQRVADHDPGNQAARAALTELGVAPPGKAPPPPARAPLPKVPPAGARTPAATSPPRPADFVDLGSLVLEEAAPRDTRMRIEGAKPTDDEQKNFEEMLAEFKRGIEQNLDADDYQSHYDLGVAFKEMGLLDEAIAEFQKALRAPEGRLRTSEALGTAFFDKGQFGIAETVLRRAVDTEAGGDEAKIGLLYWLGRAVEAQGKAPEALRCYERALAVDIRFMDLGERVPRLAAERHA
ncbi:MAG TPA: tetratricopeptide repeat protein [Gemmatimonadales bacterium]|nr:tetratricopeptide repeat protein [Gemmatimonadales bacterium]